MPIYKLLFNDTMVEYTYLADAQAAARLLYKGGVKTITLMVRGVSCEASGTFK
jgi:hypothetical protein